MNLDVLIKMAQGDISQNQYALHCGVSSAVITKILKGERKPSPNFLRKLSSKAYDDVTYKDFMIAVGYINKRWLLPVTMVN